MQAIASAFLQPAPRRTLAMVEQSGSGKSVTALALMRLLNAANSEVNSEGLWLRRNRQVIALNEQTDAEMRRVRGADQPQLPEPMTSLNRFYHRRAVAESLRLHQEGLRLAKEGTCARRKMLSIRCVFPGGRDALARYPHQLSGNIAER